MNLQALLGQFGGRVVPAVLINDVEWELLAGEPAELLKLYVALKRRMDFATGIAGRKTLLNEIVLREGFTIDPIPGRPKPKPVTREQYRSAVRRLEKLGAINVIGPLVFEFPHARRDQSAHNSYNRATTKLQPEQQPAEKSPESSNDAAFSDVKDGATTGLFLEQVPSNNLLPVSGNYTVPLPRESDTAPATAGQWCQFFIRERRFQLHVVQTPKTMPLFASWVERGITTSQMLAAMEIAEAKLGSAPDSPLYYRNFLDQMLLETQRLASQQECRHERDHRPGKPGQGGPYSEPGGLAAELLDTSWADCLNIPAD
nr:hypothetical protein [uncultured Pseudomonas sp.]